MSARAFESGVCGGGDRFADAITIAIVGEVDRGGGGVPGEEQVFKIILIGRRLSEAGGKERVAAGIAGGGSEVRDR